MIFNRCLLWGLAMMSLLCAAHLAQSAQSLTNEIPNPNYVVSYDMFAWRNEAWTGDSKHYQQLQTNLDHGIAQATKNGSLNLLCEQYLIQAQRDACDPKAQFAWAYTALQRREIDPTFKLPYVPINNALNKVSSPHVYEFTRLHFLIATSAYSIPALAPLSKRLLQKNPKDYEVMYQTIKTLDVVTTQERTLVLSYLRILLTAKLETPKYHSISGAMHFGIYLQTHDKSEKIKALNGYREYLKLAPANDSFRRNAERIIIEIQSH